MTRTAERTILPALAVVAFLAAAYAWLPLARALHYATVAVFTRPAAWHLALLPALLAVALSRTEARAERSFQWGSE